MEKEERDENESMMRAGQDVSTTISTRGWQKVIRPCLNSRIDSLMAEFDMAVTHEEFMCIQQAIKAHKDLINFIEVTLIEGKRALKELRNNP